TARSSFLRAGSQRTDRGQKPAPREPERATWPAEARGPGGGGEARIARLSNQGDPASRGELPTKPRERRLGRRQQRRWVGAKPGGDVATQAAREPRGDEPLEGRAERRRYDRVSRFERERDRALRRRSDRHLSEQSRIGGLPLEQPAEIEELH